MTAAIIDCSCAQSPTSTLILDSGGCANRKVVVWATPPSVELVVDSLPNWLGFGQADAGFGALLALPLVVVAQTRLVFLYLRFQFGEGLFAGSADVFAGAGGMH